MAATLPGIVLLLEQINVNSGMCYEAINLINVFASIQTKKEHQKQNSHKEQVTYTLTLSPGSATVVQADQHHPGMRQHITPMVTLMTSCRPGT